MTCFANNVITLPLNRLKRACVFYLMHTLLYCECTQLHFFTAFLMLYEITTQSTNQNSEKIYIVFNILYCLWLQITRTK